jgi:hypothetical protein
MPDFVSQGKIFVDIPGPGAVSRQLLTVKKFDAKPQSSREVVTTVGVEGGAGFRRKQGGFEIDMTVVREVGQNPEVDWYETDQLNKVFTITTQDENNGRRQSFTCMVSKVDTSMDDQGQYEDTVTLVATQRYPG